MKDEFRMKKRSGLDDMGSGLLKLNPKSQLQLRER